MERSATGTTATGSGTNGGDDGTNTARRKVALLLGLGFFVILSAITIGNAESLISDFAAAGIHETRAHVWIWELSSVAAWLSVMPLIWWCAAQLRPPRFGWPTIVLGWLAGLPLASAWHIAVMIGLRHGVYAVFGQTYHFEGGLAAPYLYEFRKDTATYLQFTGLAVLAQWLLARVGMPSEIIPVNPPATHTLTVTDGTTRHLLPIDTIAHIAAAGNYVEIHAGGRTLLHRATLTNVETELGTAFVRIHRGRLVNRTAIRQIDTDRSGDFSVHLINGTILGGSRRYRDHL